MGDVTSEAATVAMVTSAADEALRCRVLTGDGDWLAVQPWWDELLAASPGATPWQSWDYLSLWWHHLAQDRQLRLFVVERDGRPVLVLPLQVSRRLDMVGLSVRTVEPIATIMDVNRPRFGLGALDRDAYRCAFEALWQRRGEWDAIRIDERAEADPETALLRELAAEHGLWYRATFSHLCPWLDLRQDFDAYLRSRGRKLHKNLRAARRRLDSIGEVRLVTYQSPAEIRAGFDVVLELHRGSWKRRERVEHSQSQAYRVFYAAWLERMARMDCARVLVLYCGDRPVAATVAFMRDDTYHSAQIVHDERFASASPGTLLEAMEIESVMREGRHATYDFLGGFLNNKMRWTDTAHATSLVFVLRPMLRTALVDAFYCHAKPWVKAWLRRLGARLPDHGRRGQGATGTARSAGRAEASRGPKDPA